MSKHFDKKDTKRRESPGNPEKQPFKKKALGQHFLRKQSVVDNMIARVAPTSEESVLEIGCGDGFLTRAILAQTACKRLWCYEIDHEWAAVVRKSIRDERLTIHEQNILDLDTTPLYALRPWVVIANLPYCITFPIFELLRKNRALWRAGIVMVQEEVAQKIVARRGRSLGFVSLYLQYYFEFELGEKIEPAAFEPAPKVFSRLVYFEPKKALQPLVDEENFWKFVRLLFKMPRRTMRNNLKSTHYDLASIAPEILDKRAQELSFDELLQVWGVLTPQADRAPLVLD